MQASLLLLIGQTNYTPRTSLERTCRSDYVDASVCESLWDRRWEKVQETQGGSSDEEVQCRWVRADGRGGHMGGGVRKGL